MNIYRQEKVCMVVEDGLTVCWTLTEICGNAKPQRIVRGMVL